MIRSQFVRGLCVFSVRFESVLIYFCVAQSVLAHGSLNVRFCSCSFRLSRSTALRVMASTLDRAQLLDYKRAGVIALFEIRDGYLRHTSIKFNCYTRVVRTCSCSFRLSHSTALQVMDSTLDRAQLLDCTRAGVRRHLKSAMSVDLRRTYVRKI